MGCQTRMGTPCGCVVGAELWILCLLPTMMERDKSYTIWKGFQVQESRQATGTLRKEEQGVQYRR
jgi:hypothetical protein